MNTIQSFGLFGNLFGGKTKAPAEYDDDDFISTDTPIDEMGSSLLSRGFIPEDSTEFSLDDSESLVPSADADVYNETIESIGKPFFNTEDTDGEE